MGTLGADPTAAPHPDPDLGCIRRGLCCRQSPGWFGPGQAEQAAALLGLTPDEMVRRYLVIDRWELDGEPVEVFAPAKLDRAGELAWPTGTRVDALYRYLPGACVFFSESGCRIYSARPVECARYLCTQPDDKNLSHEAVAALWKAAAAEQS